MQYTSFPGFSPPQSYQQEKTTAISVQGQKRSFDTAVINAEIENY